MPTFKTRGGLPSTYFEVILRKRSKIHTSLNVKSHLNLIGFLANVRPYLCALNEIGPQCEMLILERNAGTSITKEFVHLKFDFDHLDSIILLLKASARND